jgi:NAD(P)-dependent dehydrogenase (short-subunit alcohol dehydrogenase family)
MTRNTGVTTAVVTGASGGIGAAIVARLRRDGRTVAAVDVTPRAGADDDQGVHEYTCDVADPDQVSSLAVSVRRDLGPVSAVVNCAGVALWFRKVAEIAPADWQAVIATNLTGAFLISRAFMPDLVATAGNIVNISSVHGTATAPGSAAYAASKAGLFGLTKATAVDYTEQGVRCNCVVLGSVDAGMTPAHEAEAARRGLEPLPIDPSLRTAPDAVADVVAFLASEAARFINGSLVPVDGGLLAWL